MAQPAPAPPSPPPPVGSGAGCASPPPFAADPLSQGEQQRELARVFNTLAGFAPKAALRAELAPLEARRERIVAAQRNRETVKLVDERGRELPGGVVDGELRRVEGEIAALTRRVHALDAVPLGDKKIRARDLQAALGFLGKAADKARGAWRG